jgi:mannan endo-1,4-beta-mannosidase
VPFYSHQDFFGKQYQATSTLLPADASTKHILLYQLRKRLLLLNDWDYTFYMTAAQGAAADGIIHEMSRKIILTSIILGVAAVAISLSAIKTSSRTPTATPTTPTDSAPASKFVTVRGDQFILNGRPYYFVGTNFWQGMNLGVNGSSGDRAQLVAELDRLQDLGVTNLRVMASSEGPNTEPHRLVPALMISPGTYDESVLDGLDFFIAEMGRRNLKTVMVLNNYWQWSGGMAQYVSWHERTPIPYPGDWGTFMSYSAKFYDCAECQTWYRNHIETMINHTNPYSKLKYRDDPTIFAWELANEPRRYPYAWIDETAAYIKSLDPNHLVTTGSEGTPPGENQDFQRTHDGINIDYATIHIWPQNWGWYDPNNPDTFDQAERLALAYLRKHVFDMAVLNKPLVLEEFGLARDWEPLHDIYDTESTTINRDRFYKAMFGEIYSLISEGGPVGGDNFWAWAGASRPGDSWIGDPPHETPGWYSVYDTDESTLAIILSHASDLKRLEGETIKQ